jgi:hypothetical protein
VYAVSSKGSIKVLNIENGICLDEYDRESIQMQGWHDKGESSQEEDILGDKKMSPVDI